MIIKMVKIKFNNAYNKITILFLSYKLISAFKNNIIIYLETKHFENGI